MFGFSKLSGVTSCQVLYFLNLSETDGLFLISSGVDHAWFLRPTQSDSSMYLVRISFWDNQSRKWGGSLPPCSWAALYPASQAASNNREEMSVNTHTKNFVLCSFKLLRSLLKFNRENEAPGIKKDLTVPPSPKPLKDLGNNSQKEKFWGAWVAQ